MYLVCINNNIKCDIGIPVQLFIFETDFLNLFGNISFNYTQFLILSFCFTELQYLRDQI